MGASQNNIMLNSGVEDDINTVQGPYHIIDGANVTNVYINIFTGTIENTAAIFSNINQSTNASYSIKDDTVTVIIDGVVMKPLDFDSPSFDASVIVCPLGQSLLYSKTFNEFAALVNNKKAVKGWAPNSVDGSGSTNTHTFNLYDIFNSYISDKTTATLTEVLRALRYNVNITGDCIIVINKNSNTYQISDVPGNVMTSDYTISCVGYFDTDTAVCGISCQMIIAGAIYTTKITSIATAVAGKPATWYKYTGVQS